MKEAKVRELRKGIRRTKRSEARVYMGMIGTMRKNTENILDGGREGELGGGLCQKWWVQSQRKCRARTSDEKTRR